MIASISTYQWLLAIHLFAAVVWVGGGLLLTLLAVWAIRSPLPGRKAEFTKEAGFVGQRIFAPTSIVLVIFGAWLAHHANYSYSRPWLMIGVIGWIASFVIGIAFLGPTGKKIERAIEAGGPDSPEASALIDRILLLSRIDIAILVIVVFDMVLKPGGAY